MAENTGKSEAEAMEELARQMWDRYFRYKASELLEHSLDGYKATVSQNNGDGTLSVTRPYDNTEVTLKCPPSLAASAGEGDQVLVVTLGNLSNAFVLCKTDLTGLGGGGDSLRPEAYDFGTIPASDYFTETLENGHTTRYNVEMDESGRIISITDTTDGFETTINWGSLTWKDQADEVGYDNSDSGLTATNVQDALDELANGGGGGGPSPSDATPQDLGTAAAGTSTSYSRGDHVHGMPSAADVGAQPTITASGILKGDGSGGISAASAGTDYQEPLTFDSAPTENSDNPVKSGGIYSAMNSRYSDTSLFSTLTDVTTDTTITLSDAHGSYKLLMLMFNSRSPAAAGYRMPLTITNQELRQGGYYPLRNPEVDGYVRVNFISGQNTQIRIQDTNIATLYLASVTGLR